jgi:hypothetical protein
VTVAEILEQVKALSPAERKELAKSLIDLLDVPVTRQQGKTGAEIVAMLEENDAETEQHWGKSLNQLLDEIGPIEMKYPEIEDPVEWVKHLRAEERRRRLGDWGDET